MPAPINELEELIAQDTRKQPPPDKLEFVRNQVRHMRDLDRQIQNLEERSAKLRAERRDLEMFTLPDLFQQIKITNIGLAAEGNEPPYEATMRDYYKANISADWPQEKRTKALEWVEAKGMGDLIRTVITIEIGRGQDNVLKAVDAVLEAVKIELSKRGLGIPSISKHQTIPWNTLTAAIREMYVAGTPLKNHEVELLGATIGKQVKLQPKKEE